MRRYATSKLRLALLVILIGSALMIMTDPLFAQVNTGQPQSQPKPSVFSLVMQQDTDPVFWTIMFLSVAGLTLIIQGVIQNRASIFMPPQTTERIREMIAQRRFKDLIDFTETDPSFVSRALNPALKRAPSFSSMKEAMETAIGEQTAEQFRKIEYLNIIGNLGPLLGLLGTVLGMIDAFSAMEASGGVTTPTTLAGGIAKALCHTMLGLMLAVPCLAAFGVLRTVVDRLTVRGALMAEELLLMIKPAEARPAAVGPARPGMMPQPAPAPAPAAPPRKPPIPSPGPGPMPAQM